MTHSLRSACVLSLAISSATVSGCADPQGEYEAFLDRAPVQEAISCERGTCTAPAVGDPDGDYLFAIASTLGATLPLLFDTQLTTSDVGGQTAITLAMQPLQATDRKTLVGTRETYGPFPVEADGTFVADLPPIVVTLEANPLSKREIEADTALTGKFCAEDDFHFGDATGTVTRPISIDLAGSGWTMQKLANPGEYPEPPIIDCEGKEAVTVDKVNPE